MRSLGVSIGATAGATALVARRVGEQDAFGMVVTQSFNGAGDTWTPTVINLFVFWFWEIPLAYLLARHTGLGAQGVFAALTIAYSSLAVVSAVVFRRGAWKRKTV